MNPTVRRLVAGGVALVVLGGTFVAAAAVGDLSEDEPVAVAPSDPDSTPAAAPGTPVAPGADEPDDPEAEPTWPSPAGRQPFDQPAAERAHQDGPLPTDDPGVITPVRASGDEPASSSTTEGPSTTATSDAADDADTPMLEVFSLVDPLPSLPWFRFLDPCADAGDDSCGTGTGGTILPLGGDLNVGALRLGSSLYDWIGITATAAKCGGVGTRPDGTVSVILFTNNPADFQVSWWAASTPDEVNDGGSVRTADSEREIWEAKILSGGTPTPDGGGVANCIVFPASMTHGIRHQVHIEATDDQGTSAEGTYTLTPPAPGSTAGGTSGGRPPLRFYSSDERHGRVVASLASRDDEELWVAELVRNGPGATLATCTSIENEVLRGGYTGTWRLFNGRTEPLIIPTTGVYPYERAYDTATSLEYWPDEGTQATLCVWITRPPVRSFDKPVVRQRTTLDVASPRWYRTRVSVSEAHLDRGVTEGPIQARIEESGFNSTFPAEVVPDGTPSGDVVIEDPVLVADSGATMHPWAATLTVSSGFGEVRTVIDTPNKLCPVTPPTGALCPTSYTRTYTVQVPGPRAGSGLCGSSFGDCDPPTTETFLGELVVSVESYAGPSGPPSYGEGFSNWDVANGTFAAAEAVGLPDHVQVDGNGTSGVASSGIYGTRPQVSVTVFTDRPVIMTASSDYWDVPGNSCGLEPQADTTLSQIHNFRWPAVCFGQTYYIEADMVDAAGRTTHAGVGGEQFYVAIVDADGFPTASIDVDLTVTPKAAIDFAELEYFVDGISWPTVTRRSDRCTESPRRSVVSLGNERGVPIIVAEPLFVAVQGRGYVGEDCDEWSTIDLTGPVDLEAVIAGPVTLHFEDDLVEVDVILRLHPRFPMTP